MKYFVVIDTNVLVSAMLKRNTPPDKVIRHIFEGNIIPLLNEEILNEYREVLNRPKFSFPGNAVKDMLVGITKDTVFVDAASVEEMLEIMERSEL